MKYAAIDIGTNAARLLIGEVTKNNGHAYVKKLSYTRVPLRLGFEVFTDGIISEKKAVEFIKTIKAFKLISEVYDIKEIRACATSAMREAKNGKTIQKRIQDETGLNVEIIDGKEEMKIIISTFFLIAVDKSEPFIVIDVGGGSTEVSIYEKGKRVNGMSFNVGTVRLLKEKVDQAIWDEIKAWIKSTINYKIDYKVFATGGNINKIHKLLGKRFMDPIRQKELNEIYNTLKKLSLEDRMEAFLLKPDRADVIVPACEIYQFITKELKTNKIFVPKIGLSDGMIYNMHKSQQ